jgi:hypothetical protein
MNTNTFRDREHEGWSARAALISQPPLMKESVMKTQRTIALLLAGLAASTIVHAAQVCQFTRNQWGLLISNCKLNELSGGRYDFVLDHATPPPPQFPNLRVTKIGAFLQGVNVALRADVENNGGRNAGAFEVVLTASVNDPLQNGVGVSMTTLPPSTVPSLAIGAGATVFPGAITLPNRNQDWDVCTAAVVDPPATGRPPSGAVLESNETDNQTNACCRVYGPNPDLTGPPACN